jgi:asparagine synthetase B (glutamine-hydrolysing)
MCGIAGHVGPAGPAVDVAGVDSSTVVAAMARLSGTPVRTFSVGFDDARYDGREYARLVAKRYGTDHHELVVTPSAVELLPRLAWSVLTADPARRQGAFRACARGIALAMDGSVRALCS